MKHYILATLLAFVAVQRFVLLPNLWGGRSAARITKLFIKYNFLQHTTAWVITLVGTCCVMLLSTHTVRAQAVDPRGINFKLPLNDDVLQDNTTGNEIKLHGDAYLTSGHKGTEVGTQDDPVNDGWLRLTPCQVGKNGYALFSKPFSPPIGVLVEFDYKMWRDQEVTSGYELGDGMSVFLYDGNTTNFTISSAGYGAPLGYARCNACSIYGTYNGQKPAATNGYLGIGLDAYGAFSSSYWLYDGPSANGVPNSVVIRGQAPDTKYIAGTNSDLGYRDVTSTRPDMYRRVRFFLMPGTRNGDYVDMNVTVQMQTQAGGPFYTVINSNALGQPVYVNANDANDTKNKSFKLGFAASTGSAVAYHEIRNLSVSAPMNLVTNNVVVGANPDLHVGDQVQYETTISNQGTVSVDTYPAQLTIVTNGVDIPGDITVAVVKNNLAVSTQIVKNTQQSTAGSQVYDITSFPPGASITLKYSGTISSTYSSAVNNARIVPPNGFGNIDSNDGRGVVQTFIQPDLASPNNVDAACADIPLGKTFSSTPTLFTEYVWTRSDGVSGGPAKQIDDIFTNNTSQDQVITYTVIPQIPSTIVSSNGSLGASKITQGGAQIFTVTVKPTTGGASAASVTVSARNDGNNLILTPTSNLSNPIYTWYKDANKTGGSIGVGTLTVSLNSTSPSLKAGDTYSYFVTVSTSSTCESAVLAGAIQVPLGIQPITLTFVDASGNAITDVLGGSIAYLKASLPAGVQAPTTIALTINRDNSSTALSGVNYDTLITPITIPAGQQYIITKAFTAQNTGIIGGNTLLVAYGVASSGYVMSTTPTITIQDSSGNTPSNKVVTISSGTVQAGNSIVLKASFPTNITSVSATTVALTSNVPVGYTVPSSVTIPSGMNSMTFTVVTVNDPTVFVDRVFSISGSVTGFTVNSGTLTVTNGNVIPIKLLFVDASGSVITSVNGGSVAYLKASLPTGVTAASTLSISLARNTSSTALSGVNYSGLLASITISAGQNSSTVVGGFTAQNTGIIGGSTILTLDGSAPTNYGMSGPASVTIQDISGNTPSNKVITISSGTVQAGNSIVLKASFPVNITSVSATTVALTSNVPVGYTVPSSVTIPSGMNSMTFTVVTVNDPAVFVDRVFSISGSVTGFTVNSGTLTVTNGNVIPIKLLFVDASGNAITSVNGGSVAYLKASLPTGVTAASTLSIPLARNTSSTALSGVNYSGLLASITISAGQNSSTVVIGFTAQNTGIIGGSTILTLDGSAPTNYGMSGPVSVTIQDISGNTPSNKVIAISSGTVNEGNAIVLSASLPSGIKNVSPLTVTITQSPAFPAPGYRINSGLAITSTSFVVVIKALSNSVSFTVNTSDDGKLGDNTFVLAGNLADPSFSVNNGTLTVTNTSAVNVSVSTTVLPVTKQLVGASLSYTTVVNNIGISLSQTTLLIETVGVDIGYQNIVSTLQKSSGIGTITYRTDISVPSAGKYYFTVNSFPANTSVTLTYVGSVSITASSAINSSTIILPSPLTNSNVGIAVVQTLIQPAFTQPISGTVCSGAALNMGFTSIPSTFTRYIWSRTGNAFLTGPISGTGNKLNDVLINTNNSISQTVTYTVTPQITTTLVSSTGISGSITTTYGGAKSFTITVKPGSVTTVASSSLINVVATNENGYLVLTPSAVGVTNPTFRWYSSLSGSEGSINDGTVDPKTGVRRILIAPPLDIGQRYDYYISVAGDNYCESDIGSNYVTISQLVILRFVDASGKSITSTRGGASPDKAYLQASLPVGVVASLGPVTVSVSRSSMSSTAFYDKDYLTTDPLGNLPTFVIPQSSNASPVGFAFTAKNRGVIGGSTTLTLSSIISPNYYYANPSTITIIDTSADDVTNRVVTLSSGMVAEGQSITMTASLPTLSDGTTVTVSRPLTVTVKSSIMFPAGYRLISGSSSQSIGGSSSFTVVIPAGENAVSYMVQTTSDAIYTNRVFSLTGSTTSSLGLSFSVVPGTLTVTNTDIPTNDAKVYLNMSTVVGGDVATIKATLLQVNTNNDIVVLVNADSPGFPSGYSVAGTNAFTITIAKGSMYGTANISTKSALATSSYVLNGLASDAALKAYKVYSGGLTVTGTSVADDQKVYLSSSTIAGGNMATVRASVIQANSASDITVVVSANDPGFIGGYSIVGTNTFTITIPRGQFYGSVTLSTITDPYTYNYTIGGVATDGAKNYVVYSGNLVVTGGNVSDDQKIYLNTSTVPGGATATIKATLISVNASRDITVLVRADYPGFPASYLPAGVSALTITIPKGMIYGTAVVNTTASMNTTNYTLNGVANDSTNKAYYVYSGSLTVTSSTITDDQKVYLSSSTIAGGDVGIIQATLPKVNTVDVVVTVRASAPGFISGYSPEGVLPFTITIPKGTLYGSSSVSTVANANTYNYTLGGAATDGSAKVYYVYSGDLIVTGSSVDDSQKVYLNSTTVEGGAVATVRATLLSVNTTRDVNVVVRADMPGFLTGYVPTATNSFTITIPKGSLYGEAKVSTIASANTYNYTLNGGANDGSTKVYYVYSGNLRVVSNQVSDDQKVFIGTRTILGGNVGVIQATLGKINSTADVIVTVQANSPGFASGYTPSGTTPFTIKIPKGSIYGTSNVTTTAAPVTYNYTIGGTASDGSAKQYYVYAGLLTVLNQNINPNNLATIDTRTVAEGVAIDMKVSVPVPLSSNLAISVTSNPSFPTNYKIKVNGSYVSLSTFTVNIPAGETSTVFTVETADDNLSSPRSFILNGAAGTSGYYVVSGNLTVLDKSSPQSITVRLRSSSAALCGGVPIDLNDYILGANPDISPALYQYYSRYPGELMVPVGTISRGGTYTIYAISPSGEVGTASFQVNVVNSQLPTLSVTPSITYYPPLALDLTSPDLIVSSSNVSSYKYYSDNMGTEVPDPKNVKIIMDQVFYIQGISSQGCTSKLQPINVKKGGDLYPLLEVNVPSLVEGSTGYFTLSLKSKDGSVPVLQQNLTFTLAPDPVLNEATTSDYTLNNKGPSSDVSLVKGVGYTTIPVKALTDKILYDDTLLVIDATNTAIGSASSSLKIIDNTANDPANRVIVLEDGTIYNNEPITLKAYLDNGFTTKTPITVSLSIDPANSKISTLSSAPAFSSTVVISANTSNGAFDVSASSNSDQFAIIKLNGISAPTGFTVNPSTVRVFNQKIHAIMAVSDNFDYVNDWATIENIEKYPNNEVAIINKWGMLVWLKKGYQNSREGGFTGQYNQGRPYNLPSGTYYYVIRIWDNSTKPDIFKGSIELRHGDGE